MVGYTIDYLEKMKEVSSMDTPPESRVKGGIGAADIQIITRLYGPDESITTGREAREPVFDNETFQQLQAIFSKFLGVSLSINSLLSPCL